MFAYCGNNPVCRQDPTGCFFLPVAFDLLEEWVEGDGSDQNYIDKDEISRKLKNHRKTRDVVDEAIANYKAGVPKENWSHGTLYYGPSDDLDLWLAIRNCEYTIDITEEQRTIGFWLFETEQVRYIITVTVHDVYDFTEQPWDGVGNYLNNFAMLAHDYLGVGKDYHLYATFTYTTSWENAG